MEFEIFSTERLLLRKLNPDVYAYVFTRYNDEQVKDFFGFSTEEDFLKERDRYNRGISTFNKSFVNFQVMDKESKKIIGACGFHTWYTEHNRAEIGYALTNENYRGKGIMTEVLPVVLDYGFSAMNLHRVEAFIGPDNEPSLKLVQKFNFRYEGHLREHYLKNGKMEDSLVFSLLRTEFEQR